MIKDSGLPFRGKAAGLDGTPWSPSECRDRGSIFCFHKCYGRLESISLLREGSPDFVGGPHYQAAQSSLSADLPGLNDAPQILTPIGEALINSSLQRCQAVLPATDKRRERDSHVHSVLISTG